MAGSSIAVAGCKMPPPVGADANSPGEAVLAQLKDTLKCGTNCGSCEPELRHMIASNAPLMAA